MLDWELILSNKYAIICVLVSSLSKIKIVSKICNEQYSSSLCLSLVTLDSYLHWEYNKIQNMIFGYILHF